MEQDHTKIILTEFVQIVFVFVIHAGEKDRLLGICLTSDLIKFAY